MTKPAFTRQHLEKVRDSFTVNLNKEEREILESSKKIIKQEKDSTAIKMLAKIGANEIHRQKTVFILDTIHSNERKNKRIGIQQFD